MLYEVIRLHARKVMLNTSPPTPAARQGHCNGLVFELVTAMRRPPIPPFAPHQRRGNNQGGNILGLQVLAVVKAFGSKQTRSLPFTFDSSSFHT